MKTAGAHAAIGCDQDPTAGRLSPVRASVAAQAVGGPAALTWAEASMTRRREAAKEEER
ncbi:MAG TPA: hypothetical protein VMF55_04375 [Solirubrobacterales bacterium]|nr:hypothetical protein [Solirubrobacterales bacterium]